MPDLTTLYPNPHGLGCPWHDLAQTFGAPNIKWCEATVCQWISEPANTWSNIPYLIIGIIMFFQIRRDEPYEVRWLAPAMFLMGTFSLMYHASNFYISQIFDFVGMYLFVFWLMVINFRRVGWIRRESQVQVQIALTFIFTVAVQIMYVTGIKFQILVAFGVGMIILTEILIQRRQVRDGGNLKFYGLGLLFIGAAQAASQLDLHRILCDPDNHWLQGHAVWHYLAAIGLYFAFLHYRALTYEDTA